MKTSGINTNYHKNFFFVAWICSYLLIFSNSFGQNIKFLPQIYPDYYGDIFKNDLQFEFNNTMFNKLEGLNADISSEGLLILKSNIYYFHQPETQEVFFRGIYFVSQQKKDLALKEFSTIVENYHPQSYQDSTLLIYCKLWMYKLTNDRNLLNQLVREYEEQLNDESSYIGRQIAIFFYYEDEFDAGYKYFVEKDSKHTTSDGTKFSQKLDYVQDLCFKIDPRNPVYYYSGHQKINRLILKCRLHLKKNNLTAINNIIFAAYSKDLFYNNSFDINYFELEKAKIFAEIKDYKNAEVSLNKFVDGLLLNYYNQTIFLNGYVGDYELFQFNNLKNIYVKLIFDNYQFLGASNRIYELEMTTKAKELNFFSALNRIVNSSNNSQLKNDFKKIIDLREEAMFNKISDGVSSKINQKWKTILLKNNVIRDYIDKSRINSYSNLTDSLKSNECILQFFLYEETSAKKMYAVNIIGGKSKNITTLKICSLDELNRILNVKTNEYKTSVYERGFVKSNYSSNKSLYNLIWKPLKNEIEEKQSIYISTVGLLNNISFNAIPINDNRYLIDEYDIHYVTDIKKIRDTEKQNFNNIALFGGINYEKFDSVYKNDSIRNQLKGDFSPFNYLNGTKKEVLKIGQLLDKYHISKTIFDDAIASEEKFKTLTSVDIIHIATHGYYLNKKVDILNSSPIYLNEFGEPLLRSGIVFSGVNYAWTNRIISPFLEDGILTSYETTKLNFKDVNLIVLSACSTGLGDVSETEGTYGLQRGFKIAGVKNIICSLWEIPDDETVELMSVFYDNLIASKDIYHSLKKAQLHLRNNPKNTPYHWGAFILVR